MEDLTTGAAPIAEAAQIADLLALGIDFDGEIVRQSQRQARYSEVIDRLSSMGLTYPCFCSRREIRESTRAPHGFEPEGAYPGTCAARSTAERAELLSSGRRPAIRIAASGRKVAFRDRLAGTVTATVDDFVLCRADGVAAYNLAVVIDDHDSGVDQVVRGSDLLETTGRQVLVHELLDLEVPEYVHVPLVLGPDGERLSKRHGSVGLKEQIERGADAQQVLALLAHSIGILDSNDRVDAAEVLDNFDPSELVASPWILDPARLAW